MFPFTENIEEYNKKNKTIAFMKYEKTFSLIISLCFFYSFFFSKNINGDMWNRRSRSPLRSEYMREIGADKQC